MQATPNPNAIPGKNGLKERMAAALFHIRYKIYHFLAGRVTFSTLIKKPRQPIPTLITSPWLDPSHSFQPSPSEYRHLLRGHPNFPYIPSDHDFSENLSVVVVNVDGELKGPRLKRGMFLIQRHQTVYICDDFYLVSDNYFGPVEGDLYVANGLLLPMFRPTYVFAAISDIAHPHPFSRPIKPQDTNSEMSCLLDSLPI